MTATDVTTGMRALMTQMVKAKQDSGFVVWALQAPTPVPLPMAGRPHGTREEAEAKAKALLAKTTVSRAWTVGADGIREVTAAFWETVATDQTKTLIRAYATEAVRVWADDLPGLLASLRAACADDPYFVAVEAAGDVELGIDSPEFDNLCTSVKVWIGELELSDLTPLASR